MENRIFLGGTCGNSNWRNTLIAVFNQIDYFNPVVDDWTSECKAIEIDEKENKCNIHLYVITNEMKGVFSIAEVIDSVHNKSKRTILHVIPTGFDDVQLRSLKAVVDLVNSRGGIAYIDKDLYRTVRIINNSFTHIYNIKNGTDYAIGETNGE